MMNWNYFWGVVLLALYALLSIYHENKDQLTWAGLFNGLISAIIDVGYIWFTLRLLNVL